MGVLYPLLLCYELRESFGFIHPAKKIVLLLKDKFHKVGMKVQQN